MIKSLGLEWLPHAVGLAYITVVLLAVGLAFWRGKTTLRKIGWAGAVLVVLTAPLTWRAAQTLQLHQRYTRANALYAQRCANAGEKISETMKHVDGLLLMKPRPDSINLSNQFALDDPYGRDFGGQGYILSFLMGRNPDGTFSQNHTKNAYRFVEIRDASTGQLFRYTAAPQQVAPGSFELKLTRQAVQRPSAKYGVTWDDISTREDRESWIAGSRLQVIELASNRVIAERIGYMFDQSLGDIRNGRSPWSYAEYTACPPFERPSGGSPSKSSRSRGFVLRVLKPINGERL